MGKLKQFDSLVIRQFEEEVFHLPTHGHTYYEIVYILKGTGNHVINGNGIGYESGDLFLLSPDDEHVFEIKESTHFALVKFTDSYFIRGSQIAADDVFSERPESFMKNRLLKEMKLVFDEPSKSILRNTMLNILAYNNLTDVSTSPLIYHQILSIFGLVKESIVKMNIRIDNGLPDVEALICYIHQHIYQPENIVIKNIAAHFNINSKYFSEYFKRKFDLSYRDYINQYRTNLIAQRILAGQLSLKQISAEFGFTDESHLCHYFKKQKQLSPKDYRKEHVDKGVMV